MSVVSRKHLAFAVTSIARHGDTDVFPYPLENHWFHDAPDAVTGLLEGIDADFQASVTRNPVVSVRSLAGVGYSGFRAATQIDPIWNAYLLALVLEISDDIEKARLPQARETVFSYRLAISDTEYTLFAPAVGWGAFQQRALALAANAEIVLSTDISDFYPRIYHHRLENALLQATENKDAVSRLIALLSHLAGGASYGLPVGGNAARVLAELLLNRTDRLLSSHGVRFIRFVDDYYLFADSRDQALTFLLHLSEFLSTEGLSLSRAKTRLMSRAEFIRSSPLAAPHPMDSETDTDTRQFLRLRLRYDPYSATADADYETLTKELGRFDVLGMLARELHKSRADEVLVRQLVKAVRFLAPPVRAQAIESVLKNFGVLYPIFPTVAILLHQLLPTLEQESQDLIFATLRDLLRSGSHILAVPRNLAFAIRLLAYDRTEDTDAPLIALYGRPGADMMIKRDIILAMARRHASYWLSPSLRHFSVVTPWEKRAMVAASYSLADEGKHWRRAVRDQLSAADRAYAEWIADKNNGRVWDIPL